MEESIVTNAGLYLTFRLGEEIFAIDVSKVREVLDLSPITKIPQAAEFMRGVINVRGSVVPVVDMRMKSGMPPMEQTMDSRIVVMEISMDEKTIILGALADSVYDVREISLAQIDPAPQIGSFSEREIIKGIGKLEDEFVIILDIDLIFSSEEIDGLQIADEHDVSHEAEIGALPA
ncbi:MAG: chemotaxis protein CheW [Desulfobacteraceae bacterium]